MRLRSSLHAICVVLAVAASSQATPPIELTELRFKELLQELQPTGREPWRSIPWKISLLDGQQKAAAEKKPVFIWAMDGHPLGCT